MKRISPAARFKCHLDSRMGLLWKCCSMLCSMLVEWSSNFAPSQTWRQAAAKLFVRKQAMKACFLFVLVRQVSDLTLQTVWPQKTSMILCNRRCYQPWSSWGKSLPGSKVIGPVFELWNNGVLGVFPKGHLRWFCGLDVCVNMGICEGGCLKLVRCEGGLTQYINSSEQIALEELKAELIKQAGCLSPPVCRGILDLLAWQSVGSRHGCPWLPHVYPPFVWSWVSWGRERELLWFCREELACSLGERSFKIQYPRKLLCWLPSIHYFVRFSAKFAHIFQIVDDCNIL